MDVKFPIGELQVPTNVTKTDVQEWLQEIESYTERLKETVASLNDEELNKKYREGSWTVRQLVHHIADSQLNMYQRLRLALTDDNPVVPAFDQDKWAPLPDTFLPVDSSIKMLGVFGLSCGKHNLNKLCFIHLYYYLSSRYCFH